MLVLLDQARERRFRPKTLGGDKDYDPWDWVAAMRERGIAPHVAQNTSGRASAIDGRTTRHPGYRVSQRIRKRVESACGGFGWMSETPYVPSEKTVGGLRHTRYRGLDRTGSAGYLVRLRRTAYNLVWMAKSKPPHLSGLLLSQAVEAGTARAV